MKAMVCFRTAKGRFAVPVESARAVRLTEGLTTLPGQRPDVVGILPGDPPLVVLAILGTGGEHVLVLTSNHVDFGLQVQEVVGVQRIDDARVGPPPGGLEGGLVVGTLRGSGDVVLIVDADVMAARL